MKSTLLQLILVAGLATSAVLAAPPVPRLTIGGEAITTTPPLSLQGGYLTGPWGACAKVAGATVTWQTKPAVLLITSADGRSIRLTPGKVFTVDGKQQLLSAGAVVSGEDLVAPLKPLFDALDCVTEWNADTNAASVWGCVTRVETRGDFRGVVIDIQTSLPTTGQLQAMADPSRSYVDLSGTWMGKQPELNYVNLRGVLRVRTGQYQNKPPIARVVADLADEAPAPRWQPAADRCGGRLIFGQAATDQPIVCRLHPRLQKVVVASPDKDTATVTAYLSDPVVPAYDVLRKPYRVLLDLGDTETTAAPTTVPVQSPFVSQVKLPEPGRLALYMSELVPFKITSLRAPDRVQITFHREHLAGKLIVVDAGHGGKDSGAVGRFLKEKDVNLDVALRTAARLKQLDARPYLTRSNDTFIDLYARPRMTNQLKADLFVSIHCNAYRPDVGSGTETYYCTPQSKELAVVMQDAVVGQLRRKDGGVHHARFCVIRETQIPAVLVELLYIDNRVEEQMLARPDVRQRAAIGICEGLRRYLEGTNSPAPTLLQEPNEMGDGSTSTPATSTATTVSETTTTTTAPGSGETSH